MLRVRSFVFAMVLAASVAAQTTNVAGTNQLTVNGAGAGATSCINIDGSAAAGLTLASSALPNSPIITAIAAACAPGALPFPGGYSVDIDLATLAFLFDGTGALIPASPITPFLNTGFTGNATLALPNVPNQPVAVQHGFVNPGYPAGLAVSASFFLNSTLQVVCTAGTPVTLGDDTTVNVSTPGFFFYGTLYNSFFINSNGNCSFGAGDTDFTETLAEFLAGPPRIAMWWDDLNPGTGGQVLHYTNGIGQAGACFRNVPEFGTSNANSFQCLFTNVNVLLAYGSMTSTDGIVGISPGGNLDPVGTAVDFTGPVLALPGTVSAYYEVFGGANPRNFGFGHLRSFNWPVGGNPTAFN